MKKININDYEFLKYKFDRANIIFSTAKGNLSFNKSIQEEKNNLYNLKEWFHVKEIGYLNQVHSDNIFIYDRELHDGDAIITDKSNIAIGVFTADCVPVIIYDRNKNVIAAVHSGWKGTYSCIVSKTIQEMKNMFQCNCEDIHVYIGPHNKVCCYEVGQELIGKFRSKDIYSNIEISHGRNLNLQRCIIKQLNLEGILKDNITSTEICTFCSETFKMHSYRKNDNKMGRMFSFIYLDEK